MKSFDSIKYSIYTIIILKTQYQLPRTCGDMHTYIAGYTYAIIRLQHSYDEYAYKLKCVLLSKSFVHRCELCLIHAHVHITILCKHEG